MSKNLTRKGLALSAVVALGTTMFAGAPAHAAAALNIAPATGTSYTVLASDTFTLKAFGNAEFSVVTATALRWRVTKPSSTSVETITDNGGSVSSNVAEGASTTVRIITPGGMTDVAGGNKLILNPTTDSATDVTYKVQAYIESDTTVGLGAGELASAEQTITFSGTATPTVVLDQVGASQTVTGTVTYSPAINYDQTTLANTKVVFTQNGTDKTITSAANRGSDSPATGLGLSSATVSGGLTVAAGDVVSAVAKTVRYDGDSTYRASASSSSSTDAATATIIESTVTKGANIAAGATTTSYVIRKGTTSFSYVLQFKKSSTTNVPAGQPVALTFHEVANLDDPDSLKLNGKAVSNSADTVVSTVTGTDGKVTVTVESASAAVDDEFEITAASGSATSNVLKFKYVAAALTAAKEVSAPLVNDPSTYTRTIVRLGTLSTSIALVDQFGSKWTSANTATTYRIEASRISGNTGLATWSTVISNFTDGVAPLTITDNSTDNTQYGVTVVVKRSQDGTGAWGDAPVAVAHNINLKTVSALSTPSKITLGNAVQGTTIVSDADGAATNSAARSTATLSRFDARVDTNANAGLAIITAHSTTITGVVKRADGGVVPGATVTLTATGGVYFGADAAGNRYVVDGSITVTADENGKYTAYVFSSTGGTKSIVITSGAATATAKIKFAAALANSATAIAITAPEYTSAGRSVDVTVLLTDKYGAPVQSTSASPLRVSVTGAGSYTTIAADSDADGLVSFKLIFGANETGAAVIKATYDAANDGTADVTVTKTVTIGAAPAAADTAAVSGSTGKFYVSATAAAGKLVVVKVAGKFVTSFKATGSKKSVAVKSTKGSKKVTVYVGGKLVATKTVTVK